MSDDDTAARAQADPRLATKPVLPPGGEVIVERTWADGCFACDPTRCAKVCCTGWPAGQGIRLTVADLIRLRDAGQLDSAEGRFRAHPPDYPRLRSIDGHCVHYDSTTRRCTIWEHRPLICRTFPFAIASFTPSGRLELSFAPGCSLTPEPSALPAGASSPTGHRVMAVRRGEDAGEPASALAPYERAHLDAAIDAVNEHERSRRLVAEHPDRLREVGLGRFLDSPETGTSTAG